MKTVAYALAIFVIRLQSIQSFSSRAEPGCSICLNMASNSELDQISKQKQPCSRKSKRLYSFEEARKIARGHGFSSRQEFIDYDCAGAYQLPKDADLVWKDDWRGWDDFLGVPLSFEEGRDVARSLVGINTEEDYMNLIKSKTIADNDAASRLPYRPDLLYKEEWISWEDFLQE